MEVPNHESQRLDALRQLRILDTEAESDFDDIVKLASSICGTSVSLINLIDEKRHWFKAKTGIDVNEISPEVSFCSHTILQDDVLVVPDTREDIRFSQNPLVVWRCRYSVLRGRPVAYVRRAQAGYIVCDRSAAASA